MTDGRDLADMDVDELKDVVELISGAGYHVRGIDSVSRTRNGVQWDITVEASNRSAELGAGAGAVLEDPEPQDEADDEDVQEAIDETDPEGHDEDPVEDIEEAVEDTNDDDEDVQEDTEDVDDGDDDEDLTTDELLEQWVEGELEDNEEIAKSSTDIGDELDIDGRAVPHALKRLDGYDVEKREPDEDHKGSVWVVTPVDEETVYIASGHKHNYHRDRDCSRLSNAKNVYDKPLSDTPSGLDACGYCCDVDEGKSDQDDDTPGSESDPDGEHWCGYCGAGPESTPGSVEAHHDDEGHPGEPVVLDEDPEDVDADEHRIGDSLDDVEETTADGGAVSASAEVDLPDGLTADGIREFIESSESIPYLGVMADRFEVEEDRMRVILHKLGLYGDVIDASESRGDH